MYLSEGTYKFTAIMEQANFFNVGLANMESTFWRSAANNVFGYSYFPLAGRSIAPLIRQNHVEFVMKEEQRDARTIIGKNGDLWTEESNHSGTKTPILDAASIVRKVARFAIVVARIRRELTLSEAVQLKFNITGLDRQFYLQCDPRELDHQDPMLWGASRFSLPERQILEAQFGFDPMQSDGERLVQLVHGCQRDLFYPLRVGPSARTQSSVSISYSIEAVRRYVQQAATEL